MSDAPDKPQAKPANNKTIIIVVVVIVVLAIGGFIVRTLSQKVAGLVGEKAAEKIIENATGGKADIDINSDTVTVKTDEGTFSTGTNLPANWPKDAPVYPGSKITYSGSTNPQEGSSGFSVMSTTNDSVQKVTDYYTKELVSQGWKIESTSYISGTSILGATKDKRSLSMSASVSDGTTSVTLVVSTNN